MKANYKRKMFYTDADISKQVNVEWESKVDAVYNSAKYDIAAQIMAVCCTVLSKQYGFGRERLKRFRGGVSAMFELMGRDGILGKEFSPVNCIEYMRTEYGIDLDESEVWER